MCIVLFNLQKIFLQPSEVIKFKSYIKHEMLDEKKSVYQLNLNKYIVTTWTLLESSYVILISNNISSLNTKHKMLCFKETLTLGIDVFYEPNNSK